MNRETAKKQKKTDTAVFQEGFLRLLYICKSLHEQGETVSALASRIAHQCHSGQYRDTYPASNEKPVAYITHCQRVKEYAMMALASEFQDDTASRYLLQLERGCAEQAALRESVSSHKSLDVGCIFGGGGITGHSDLEIDDREHPLEYLREQVRSAALLHDTVEDTFMELESLCHLLSPNPNHLYPYALHLVYQLTNLTEMGKGFEGREVQNALDYFYYSNLTPLALLIKTADRRHNMETARLSWKIDRWNKYQIKTKLFLQATDLALLNHEEVGYQLKIPIHVRTRVKNMIEYNRNKIKEMADT